MIKIEERLSPNWGPRKSPVTSVVIHHTGRMTDTLDGVCGWFGSPLSGVSAHYVIGRDGAVARCVPEDRIGWHAGKSELLGVAGVNHYSIGIELCGDGNVEPFTGEQIAALTELVRGIMRRWPGVTPQRVVGHADVCVPVGRKVDPGKHFPWQIFRDLLLPWEGIA